MNKCRVSHLRIGEPVTITMKSAKCLWCGGSVSGMKTEATYQGHYTDGHVYHWFLLESSARCSACDTPTDKYIELCDGGGEWVFAHEYAELDDNSPKIG